MTRARVESVPKDDRAARMLLQGARDHLKAAGLPGIDAKSAYILLYEAARKAVDAVLAADGCRVSSGDAAHKIRIEQVRKRLGQEHGRLLARIDQARKARHNVSYRAGTTVPEQQLTDLRDAAQSLIAAAAELVGP